MFPKIAKWISNQAGSSKTFFAALGLIIIWGLLGPITGFSDSWQLVINTGTTIVTFLMVFLIQNTQNRDMMALQVKLDEIIRSIKSAHNEMVDIENLSDDELEKLHQHYVAFADKIKEKRKALLHNSPHSVEEINIYLNANYFHSTNL